MVGLPRAIIKKYGVTKKAWAVFRGRGSASPKRARRAVKRRARARGVVRMARRRGRSRSSGGLGLGGGGMLGGTFKNALAGFGAGSLAQNIGFGGILPEAIAGYVVAGPLGAIGGAAHTYVKFGGGGVSVGGGYG